MVLVADDLAGENISQTVMVARADDNGALLDSETMQSLKQCWDKAVDLINADPENWRELLTEKAQLPVEIAGSYPITHYSHASRAEVWMVGNVQDWMREKGYLTASVSYSPQTGLLTSSSSGE
jgi:NitT/TauT family transport system substrate-binding protein